MTNEEARQWFLKVYSEIKGQGYVDENEEAYELAIKALEQVSEIEENIIKYMKKYPNHVGNTDFWEGFYACRNVVLQLDNEYSPKEQESCDDKCHYCEHNFTPYQGNTGEFAEQEPMHELTEEEAKAYSKALDKMYKPTGFNVFNEPCDVFDKYGNYKYSSDVELTEPNTATSMSCDDAISRQAEIDDFTAWREKLAYSFSEDYSGVHLIDSAISVIRKMPSIQPKQKIGHWILDETDNSITCDKCGCLIYANDISNGNAHYCPNCGAKMVEKTCDTCEYHAAAFMPCNACENKSEWTYKQDKCSQAKSEDN